MRAAQAPVLARRCAPPRASVSPSAKCLDGLGRRTPSGRRGSTQPRPGRVGGTSADRVPPRPRGAELGGSAPRPRGSGCAARGPEPVRRVDCPESAAVVPRGEGARGRPGGRGRKGSREGAPAGGEDTGGGRQEMWGRGELGKKWGGAPLEVRGRAGHGVRVGDFLRARETHCSCLALRARGAPGPQVRLPLPPSPDLLASPLPGLPTSPLPLAPPPLPCSRCPPLFGAARAPHPVTSPPSSSLPGCSSREMSWRPRPPRPSLPAAAPSARPPRTPSPSGLV